MKEKDEEAGYTLPLAPCLIVPLLTNFVHPPPPREKKKEKKLFNYLKPENQTVIVSTLFVLVVQWTAH